MPSLFEAQHKGFGSATEMLSYEALSEVLRREARRFRAELAKTALCHLRAADAILPGASKPTIKTYQQPEEDWH